MFAWALQTQTLETQFEALSWQRGSGSRVPEERRTQRCGDSIGRKNHRQLSEVHIGGVRWCTPTKLGRAGSACRFPICSACMIRDAKIADFPAILGLNLEMEQYLSPLNEELLRDLHAVAVYHRVIETKQGEVAGFLLALREGADYSSVNYRWFAERYRQFLYVDRIVVAAAQQGKRLGQLLYEDLFAFARMTRIAAIACEFDIEPPNEASRRFHSRFGFREVETQWVAGGNKRVSLQLAEI